MDHIILNTGNGLDSVKNWLCNMRDKSTPKYFEILMDGKRIVHKTKALEEFDAYKSWLNEFTQSLRVMVYNTENTHRAQVFELRTNKYVEGQSNNLYATRKRSLSEDEIEKRAQAKFEEQKRNARLSELTTENRETKKRLADAEAYIQKLENEKNKAEKAKDSFDLEGVIKMMLPGLQQQMNGPEQKSNSANEMNGAEAEEATVSFRRKESEKESEQSEQEVLNAREKRDLEMLRQSYVKIGEENYAKMIRVLSFCSTHPEFINTTHNTLMQVAEQLGWKE